MNDQLLKQVLDEVAAAQLSTPGPDLDVVWQTGRRRRTRGAVLMAGGLVVALAAAAGGAQAALTALGSDPVTGMPSPAASPSPAPSASLGGNYAGAGVWWAPPATAEGNLPWLGSRLPRTIDLAPDPVADFAPGVSALALFTVVEMDSAGEPDRLLLLTTGGELRLLPAKHLRPFQDEGGNAAALTPFNGGLAPDGWSLFIAQQDSLELYNLRTGTWLTLATGEWVAEGARWLDAGTIWVPDVMGADTGTTWAAADGVPLAHGVGWGPPELAPGEDDQPYGVWVDADQALAGSYFLAGPVPGGQVSNPEGIVARTRGTTAVLALAQDGRGKACCAAVGWLDPGTVAFRSQQRVLAWRVATGLLHRVSDITGLAANERVDITWAWRSLG